MSSCIFRLITPHAKFYLVLAMSFMQWQNPWQSILKDWPISCREILFLQIFRNGDTENPQEYNGPRDADGIVKYLKKKCVCGKDI